MLPKPNVAAFEYKVESVINAGRGSGMINSESGSDLNVFLKIIQDRDAVSSGSELLSSRSDRTHTAFQLRYCNAS
jgi:hypothetical protein